MAKFSSLAVLRAYWRHLKEYKYQLLVLTLVVTSIFVLDLVTPLYYKVFFDTLVSVPLSQSATLVDKLTAIMVIILILNIVRWVAFRTAGFWESSLVSRVLAKMDEYSFSYLLGHAYAYFTNNFVGSLTRKIKRFSDAYETLEGILFWNFIPLAITVAMSLAVLFRRNFMLGLVMLLSVLLILVANIVFALWKLKLDVERAAKDSEVSGALTDAVTNNVNIKVFTARAFENRLYAKVRDELRRLQLRSWKLAETSFAVQAALMVAVEFGIMYVAIRLYAQGLVTIGDFALIQSYLITLFDRIWNIGRVLRQYYEAMANAKEMVEVLETPYAVDDKRGAKALKIGGGRIEFENVSFKYGQRDTLSGFDMRIAPGERVALVGPSGAGKSTVVKLLLRFFDVNGGRILIDGQDISQVKQDSLRSRVAFVPQDPILFHRTLMDNIRYGRRDATDSEVIEAAQKARCHDFIQDLPEGYRTFVGERGIKLSGGERQRVAIARAILKNAPILVLDEATSSLDSESEHLIQEALAELMSDKTVIVIAHRLSTIMQMDRIVVMDQGKVIDQGTHQELLSRAGIYQKLWNIQAGGFIG